MTALSHVVAVVGRPNVGKSTLFNRLTGRRISIVRDEPGITRDRIYADTEWRGRRLTLVDTGGLVPGAGEGFPAAIAQQVEVALEEAAVIVLVVDARAGVTAVDEDIARRLRRSGKPVVVCANKIDDGDLVHLAHAFHGLGLGEPVPVSAEHGLGTGDLLDRIVDLLPGDDAEPAAKGETPAIRVVVLGRPNVGKSSLVNRLLGQDRVIVSDVPGTTRDAVDVAWEYDGDRFVLIDTAGLRRQARVSEAVEYYSVVRARRALERADVALVLMDAAELLTEQDRRIVNLAEDAGRALIIVVNKWDLVDARQGTADAVRQRIRDRLPQVDYAPIVFTSALTGRGISRLPGVIRQVYEAYTRDVGTGLLNRILQDAVERHHPPSVKGRRLRIRYATQVRRGPPTFLVFVNDPKLLVENYRRYLERRIREAVPLEGTPIRLVFRPSPS
nr:ribosome biogenesis GTPase Der [Bacillota bacterium]